MISLACRRTLVLLGAFTLWRLLFAGLCFRADSARAGEDGSANAFRIGMLADAGGKEIALDTLLRLPGAFVSGTYRMRAEVTGVKKIESWNECIASVWQGGFSTTLDPHMYSLYFLIPEEEMGKLEGKTPVWRELIFRMKRVKRTLENGRIALCYCADVSGIKSTDNFENFDHVAQKPASHIGKSPFSWCRLERIGYFTKTEPRQRNVFPIWERKRVKISSRDFTMKPDEAERMAYHNCPFPCSLAVSQQDGGRYAIEIMPQGTLHPFDNMQHALLYVRFAYPHSLPSLGNSIRERIFCHTQPHANEFDKRESGIFDVNYGGSAQDLNRGIRLHFKPGYMFFRNGKRCRAETIEEIKALNPVPAEIYERTVRRITYHSGPGRMIGGGSNRTVTVHSVQLLPVFKRMVYSAAAKNWLPREFNSASESCCIYAMKLKDYLGEFHETMTAQIYSIRRNHQNTKKYIDNPVEQEMHEIAGKIIEGRDRRIEEVKILEPQFAKAHMELLTGLITAGETPFPDTFDPEEKFGELRSLDLQISNCENRILSSCRLISSARDGLIILLKNAKLPIPEEIRDFPKKEPANKLVLPPVPKRIGPPDPKEEERVKKKLKYFKGQAEKKEAALQEARDALKEQLGKRSQLLQKRQEILECFSASIPGAGR